MCKLSHSIVEHVIGVQGHKVKVQTAITQPRIARLSSNFVQSLTAAQPADDKFEVSRSKVKDQGHGVKVQGHSVT